MLGKHPEDAYRDRQLNDYLDSLEEDFIDPEAENTFEDIEANERFIASQSYQEELASFQQDIADKLLGFNDEAE
jgi:hypothetical protein